MFECDDPLYVIQRDMERAIDNARDAAAYASADADTLKKENDSLYKRVTKLEKLVERLCKVIDLPPEPIEPTTQPPVRGFVWCQDYKFDVRLWLEYGATEDQIATVLAGNPISVGEIAAYITDIKVDWFDPDFGCRVVDKAKVKDLKPDWIAYISADQTAQWLKVNRPEMVASQLQGDRRIGMLLSSNEQS